MRRPVDSLNGRSFQQYYREVEPRQGVQTECRRCFKELRQMVTLYENSSALPSTLTVHFEQLESSFEPTVRRLFSFAGLEGVGGLLAPWRAHTRFEQLVGSARKHDLSRRAPSTATREAGHVSSKVEKAGLRAMLLASALAPELQRLRHRLGYAVPGPANGSAASRNWMLHALARYEEDAAPRAVARS